MNQMQALIPQLFRSRPSEPIPQARLPLPRRRPGVLDLISRFFPKPLLFTLEPCEASFANEAGFGFESSAWVPATPARVFDEFSVCLHGRRWVQTFQRFDTLTPGAPPERCIHDETFALMKIRLRMLESERGKRWVCSLDAISFPFVRKLLQVVTFEPANGGTNFRWRFYYTPSWLVRPFQGLLRKAFAGMFNKNAQLLADFFQERNSLLAVARKSLKANTSQFEQLFHEYEADPERVEAMSAKEVLERLEPDVQRLKARERASRLERFTGREPTLDTVEAVQQQVRSAVQNKTRLLIRGSLHSAERLTQDNPSRGLRAFRLAGELRKIEEVGKGVDEEGRPFTLVRVGAGCYLGPNPNEPDIPREETLTYWLDEHGHALPLTGGITHQTLGGFLQTGSEGGSHQYSFGDAVMGLELVDGEGNVRTFSRPQDEFFAAGISMGLFGVITHVTLKVYENYWVEGREENKELEDSWIAPGQEEDFARLLQSQPYLRLNWFPQKGVQRVTQWSGKPVKPGSGPRVPYSAALRDPFLNVMAAATLELTDILLTLDPEGTLVQQFVATLISKFVPLDPPQLFRDAWHETLPMDNPVHTEDLLKVFFSELWLPVERTSEVLEILRDVLKDPRVAWNFAVELYGAKQSPFWLSPSNAGPVLRVDPYWWAYNGGSPEDFFGNYWKRLLSIQGARFHWGKYQPVPGQKYGGTRFDLDYLRGVYPRMDEWLALRAKMDPHGVFLTDSWAELFGPGGLIVPRPTQGTHPVSTPLHRFITDTVAAIVSAVERLVMAWPALLGGLRGWRTSP